MNSITVKNQNGLFRCIPQADWERIFPHIQPCNLKLGQIVSEPNIIQKFAYFPSTAIISLLYSLENGASAEMAVVGNEGMAGVCIFMGGESTTSDAVVQSEGLAFKISSDVIVEEFNKSPAVMHLLLRFTQALITQMSQTAVCNRHHNIDEQLCRWLLLSIDRLQSNVLVMTQQLIANMLGVRREGVTEVALKLQKAGLIQYARGHITVLNRPDLELRTCECYKVVKDEYKRLLPAEFSV